jgi:hypothetical protein
MSSRLLHLDVRFEGVERASAGVQKALRSLHATGHLRRAVQAGARVARDYASSITHIWTGTLATSHHYRTWDRGPYDVAGEVYLGPERNPRTAQAASYYGPFEHARGGSHAFYARTEAEAGHLVQDAIWRELRRGFP